MAHHHRKPAWRLPEREATPEQAYLNRRQILAALGLAAAGTGLGGLLPRPAHAAAPGTLQDTISGLQALHAPRSARFQVDGTMTPPEVAGQYNNFYEFSREKDDVWLLASKLTTRPWTIEVGGMVDKPGTYDVEALMRSMPMEERVYRFRCVEAWSMVVPWTGFPFRELLKKVGPKAGAKFVAMTTFMRPAEAPEQASKPWFGPALPWPYTEGLTLEEASNELTLLSVGLYGHVLPNQHGAPIRLVVPWKYGFKNIKSIVKIELTDKRPATFWNELVPSEYGFVSNVNPKIPHPRWSQAFERDIGTRSRKPTLLYNGYADYVGGLYKEA
jgi:methionine sulfoxide reductase catalytic subunit